MLHLGEYILTKKNPPPGHCLDYRKPRQQAYGTLQGSNSKFPNYCSQPLDKVSQSDCNPTDSSQTV